MYFKDFPKFLYDFNYGTNSKTSIVTDITRNVRFRKELLSSVTYYDEYDIVDGDTPEIIAEKIYGNAEYHWIIMLANERYDYIADFPLDHLGVLAAADSKYNPTLHSSAGNWYIEETNGGTPETNLRTFNFRITDAKHAFDPETWTNPGYTYFIIKGETTDGSLVDVTNPYGELWVVLETTLLYGFDYNTQVFSYPVSNEFGTGTPIGDLTITSVGFENNIRYWIDENGFKVNSDHPGATSITGLQEEELLNESKRRIKIISPQLVNTILKNFKDSL